VSAAGGAGYLLPVARDLILATAEGYGWQDVRPFVDSLRETDFRGDVCFFASQLDVETLGSITEAGIDVVRPRRTALDRRLRLESHERIASRLRWPPGTRFALHAASAFSHDRSLPSARVLGQLANPEIARYAWYLERLTTTRTEYGRVMLTDVRDVVFLGSPFTVVEGAESVRFFLESENVTIADSAYNRSWLLTAYGEEMLEALRDRPISCSGVTIGSVDGVLAYLTIMVQELARLPKHTRGIDQAVHNVVVHQGLVPGARLVPNLEGAVLTVGKMSAAQATQALSERRESVKVVHQYDRHPELAAMSHATSNRDASTSLVTTRRHGFARRQARFLVPPLAGIAAFALTAALAEAFTDRDWSLSGLEWPEDFATAALLVCLVPLVLWLVSLVTDARATRSKAERAPEG
jgi:hypothetical protein